MRCITRKRTVRRLALGSGLLALLVGILPAASAPAAAQVASGSSGIVCTTSPNATFSLTAQSGYIGMPDQPSRGSDPAWDLDALRSHLAGLGGAFLSDYRLFVVTAWISGAAGEPRCPLRVAQELDRASIISSARSGPSRRATCRTCWVGSAPVSR